MTEVDRRHLGETEDRGHGFEVVLAVDDVRRDAQGIEVIDYRTVARRSSSATGPSRVLRRWGW